MPEKAETDINLHVVFVAAWIKKGNKYLIAKRRSDDPQAGGLWAIPGGKVDNELGMDIMEETVKREIKEEVGVEVKDPLKYVCSDAFIRSGGQHVVGIVFLVDYKSGKARPLEDQDEVRWMTLEEIEELIKKDKKQEFIRNFGLNIIKNQKYD